MTKLIMLPFEVELNTVEILKKLSVANNGIGELKGIINILPNPNIVLSLINISEAKDSSAIENIITTYEDIYKELISKKSISKASKEVLNYRIAIEYGFKELREKGFLGTNTLVDIQRIIEPNMGGIRKLPGTVIKNMDSNQIVHTPPQNEQEIRDLLKNLEDFMNLENEYDPLINMALIHFQFESIHPFYDGNGRTGRILNILYLVLKEKIQSPILYLSKFIIEQKDKYYELLQKCNKDIQNIPDMVLFILDGIIQTSHYTIDLVLKINELIAMTKIEMNLRLPHIYSEDIVNHLFGYLYTKNEFFRSELNISRPTATKYLKDLEKEGFVVSERVGKEVVYKNIQLLNIFN